MLKPNEYKILGKLFDDLTKNYTINELSKILRQKYAQTHRTIKELNKKNLISIKNIGNNNIIELDFSIYNPEYISVEIHRMLKIKKSEIKAIYKELSNQNKNFICILFGSHAENTHSKKSDIDLLFITTSNIEKFEKNIRNKLSFYDIDLHVIDHKSLFEMWSKKELNVGNEILKKHIILFGYEEFLTLLRKKNGY